MKEHYERLSCKHNFQIFFKRLFFLSWCPLWKKKLYRRCLCQPLFHINPKVLYNLGWQNPKKRASTIKIFKYKTIILFKDMLCCKMYAWLLHELNTMFAFDNAITIRNRLQTDTLNCRWDLRLKMMYVSVCVCVCVRRVHKKLWRYTAHRGGKGAYKHIEFDFFYW